ncbi:transcriptional regulator [Thermoplasma sp. Kam2015]|nr:transcriptional regulator [Thermoplasma sp. Kam2015]
MLYVFKNEKILILRLEYLIAVKKLLDVSHVSSRGSSLRITIPKKVIQKLDIKPEDIIGFFEDDGKVTIEKIE